MESQLVVPLIAEVIIPTEVKKCSNCYWHKDVDPPRNKRGILLHHKKDFTIYCRIRNNRQHKDSVMCNPHYWRLAK